MTREARMLSGRAEGTVQNVGKLSGSRSFDRHLLYHYVLRRPVLAIAWERSDFVHYILPLHDFTKDRMLAR